ncbi:protein of unknown function [Ectopseudomonas oleovorans]|nr:protein of unknown function [Pseudomonas oleovorans]
MFTLATSSVRDCSVAQPASSMNKPARPPARIFFIRTSFGMTDTPIQHMPTDNEAGTRQPKRIDETGETNKEKKSVHDVRPHETRASVHPAGAAILTGQSAFCHLLAIRLRSCGPAPRERLVCAGSSGHTGHERTPGSHPPGTPHTVWTALP